MALNTKQYTKRTKQTLTSPILMEIRENLEDLLDWEFYFLDKAGLHWKLVHLLSFFLMIIYPFSHGIKGWLLIKILTILWLIGLAALVDFSADESKEGKNLRTETRNNIYARYVLISTAIFGVIGIVTFCIIESIHFISALIAS